MQESHAAAHKPLAKFAILGCEVTQPTPEGTSNGLIQLFGQASVVFVYIMEALKTSDGSFTPSLLLAIGLLVISALLVTQMKDPQKLN